MVTISIELQDFLQLLGVNETNQEKLDDLISISKAEVEDIVIDEETGEKIVRIDVKTSNRPDLWCGEGIAREVKGFLGKEKGLPNLAFPDSGFEVNVEPGLEGVRPYIAMAIAENVELSDYLIKQLIQLQEKVDFSYGRKRKRTSIGFYDLDLINFPVTYGMEKKTLKFKPLNTEIIMSLEQIIKEHPKGIEYAHILSSCKEEFPILKDAEGKILSFPPIINSDDLGHITEKTRNLLVEVTGTDQEAVVIVVNLIAQTLQDRGAIIKTLKINYPKNMKDKVLEKYLVTPQVLVEHINVSVKQINKYLGTSFTAKQMKKLLEKRRCNVKITGKDTLEVYYPPYRYDFMHWVDVSEEVAIAADYNMLTPSKMKAVTIGKLLDVTEHENLVRKALLGLGAMEIQSYTLTSMDILVSKMNQDSNYEKTIVSIKNPTTMTYSVLRNRLLPIILEFLGKNSHNEYPQIVYEVGESVRLVDSIPETYSSACYAVAGPGQDFSSVHAALNVFMTMIAETYELKEAEYPEFLEGRCADIIINGKKVGVIGEIHPQVITNFGIVQPIAAFEVDLSKLTHVTCKPFRP